MTVLLVALALVFILAMSALAIDLGTLYVVRSDMQRAADAAALAGARGFADSGVTSGATSLSQARGLANSYAQLMIANSPVAGRVLAGTGEIVVTFPDFGTTSSTNPHIQVKLQRADLPVFFARIWGARVETVSATATAEAYNPSGNTIPLSSSIKPWAIPNCDPSHATGDPTVCQGHARFVDPVSGSVVSPDIVGKLVNFQEALFGDTEGPGVYFNLLPDYSPAVSLCPALGNAPTCAAPQALPNYFDSIQCTTNLAVNCQQPLIASPAIHRTADMQAATSCLIHAHGLGGNQGQDIFNFEPAALPQVLIIAGYSFINSDHTTNHYSSC